MTDLLNLVAVIIIFGIGLWIINAFIPMPGIIVSLLNLLVFIVLVIYILQFFGLIHPIFPMLKLFK